MATQPIQASALSARVAQGQGVPEGAASELRGEQWRTSSYSAGGECVSVREVKGGKVALRNSKRPKEGTLVFSRGQLAAWIAGCVAGEFDDSRPI
jgi:hypothetical protein